MPSDDARPTSAVIAAAAARAKEAGAPMAGLLTPAPSAPCSDAWTMLSTSESSRSDAKAFSVLPFTVNVHTSSFVPQSFGTLTLKTNRLRRGRKRVGWP